jgi:hypothetical protein
LLDLYKYIKRILASSERYHIWSFVERKTLVCLHYLCVLLHELLRNNFQKILLLVYVIYGNLSNKKFLQIDEKIKEEKIIITEGPYSLK